MKKKRLKISLTSLLTCVFLGLSSCGGDTPSGHIHHYSSDWEYNETQHYHVCTVCGEKGEFADHTFNETVIKPDYDHGGYTRHECSVCHYYYDTDPTDPLLHHYSDTWSKNDTHHWHACTDEGYEDLFNDYETHDFGDWIIDEPATEDHDGTRHHVCSICQKSVSETYEHEPYVPVERVYIASTTISLLNGYTYTLKPVVTPYNATKNIKYEIQNPTLLSVENDVATAKAAGNTIVFAYNDDDDDDVRDEEEKYIVLAFSISEPDPTKRVIVQESVTLKVDETKKLTYSSENITAQGFNYGFYSEDESICTISAGNVKGHKAGVTRVSVSFGGYRAYCDVTVVDNVDASGVRASSITSEDNLLMNKGESKTLNYSILPSNAVDGLASVSSNSKAVKVNADKSITAVSGGSAVITLTTENNKSTRVLITVKDDAQTEGSYYNNYYGDLTWKNTQDLKNKLYEIISNGVTPLKYGGSPANWESNQFADQDLYDFSYVDGVYISDPLFKTATKSAWEREHAFCASLMCGVSTGAAVTSLGRSTDFHNLFAAYNSGNSSRGNKDLGYTSKESAKYVTIGDSSYAGDVFEANDVDKGRLARAIFYMGLMYDTTDTVDVSETWDYFGPDKDTHSGQSKTVHVNYDEKPLRILEDYVEYSHVSLNNFMYSEKPEINTLVEYYRDLVRAEKPTQETDDYDVFRELAYEKYVDSSMPFAIGLRSDLLKWNSFAVDHLEMQHNESVYSHYCTFSKGTQGNRNPFVDYPQLVDYIYGDLKDVPGSLSELTPTYLALEMDKDEIHHYAVESENIKTFESGTKPTVDDFDIKAIKNDLSEGVLDKSKISVEDYTFIDDDVLTGKVITITTDKNTLLVPCKVTSESVITFDTCAWNHTDDSTSGHNKDCYGTWAGTVANNASFSGLDFVVTLGNEAVVTGNKITNSKTNGTKFGTADIAPQSLTFETKNIVNIDGKTKVNAVFFIASTASGCSYKYKIYIGDNEIESGSFTGSNIEKSVILSSGNELTGKVKIEFTDINKAINIRGLAINAIA